VRTHREAPGRAELAVFGARGAPFSDEAAAGIEDLDAVVVSVGDVDISLRVGLDVEGGVELAVA